MKNKIIAKPALYLILFIYFFFADASRWEYVGPDTISFTAMYDWGKGHLIAASKIDWVGTDQPLYESYDYGKTWDTLCVGFTKYKIENLSHIGKKLYACLNDVFISKDRNHSSGFESFYASTDSGKTWTCATNFPGSKSFWAVGNDSTVLVGNTYHVSKSNDSGKTWRLIEVKDSLGGVLVCYSVAMYNDTIYAGCHTGIWVSKDWGETWVFRSRDGATIYSLNFIGKILIYGTQASSAYSRNFGLESSWTVTLNLGPDHYTKTFPIKDSIAYATVQPPNSGNKTLCYFSADTAKSFTRFFIEDDTTVNIKVNGFFSDGVYAFALTKKGIYRSLIYDNTIIKSVTSTFNKLQPKPFIVCKDRIILDIPLNNMIELTLLRLDGKAIKKLPALRNISNKQQVSLSDVNIPNGLYILKLKINNSVYTQRILIQN